MNDGGDVQERSRYEAREEHREPEREPVDPMTAMPRTRQSNQTFPSRSSGRRQGVRRGNEPLQGFEKLRQIPSVRHHAAGPRPGSARCCALFSLACKGHQVSHEDSDHDDGGAAVDVAAVSNPPNRWERIAAILCKKTSGQPGHGQGDELTIMQACRALCSRVKRTNWRSGVSPLDIVPSLAGIFRAPRRISLRRRATPGASGRPWGARAACECHRSRTSQEQSVMPRSVEHERIFFRM